MSELLIVGLCSETLTTPLNIYEGDTSIRRVPSKYLLLRPPLAELCVCNCLEKVAAAAASQGERDIRDSSERSSGVYAVLAKHTPLFCLFLLGVCHLK